MKGRESSRIALGKIFFISSSLTQSPFIQCLELLEDNIGKIIEFQAILLPYFSKVKSYKFLRLYDRCVYNLFPISFCSGHLLSVSGIKKERINSSPNILFSPIFITIGWAMKSFLNKCYLKTNEGRRRS